MGPTPIFVHLKCTKEEVNQLFEEREKTKQQLLLQRIDPRINEDHIRNVLKWWKATVTYYQLKRSVLHNIKHSVQNFFRCLWSTYPLRGSETIIPLSNDQRKQLEHILMNMVVFNNDYFILGPCKLTTKEYPHKGCGRDLVYFPLEKYVLSELRVPLLLNYPFPITVNQLVKHVNTAVAYVDSYIYYFGRDIEKSVKEIHLLEEKLKHQLEHGATRLPDEDWMLDLYIY